MPKFKHFIIIIIYQQINEPTISGQGTQNLMKVKMLLICYKIIDLGSIIKFTHIPKVSFLLRAIYTCERYFIHHFILISSNQNSFIHKSVKSRSSHIKKPTSHGIYQATFSTFTLLNYILIHTHTI